MFTTDRNADVHVEPRRESTDLRPCGLPRLTPYELRHSAARPRLGGRAAVGGGGPPRSRRSADAGTPLPPPVDAARHGRSHGDGPHVRNVDALATRYSVPPIGGVGRTAHVRWKPDLRGVRRSRHGMVYDAEVRDFVPDATNPSERRCTSRSGRSVTWRRVRVRMPSGTPMRTQSDALHAASRGERGGASAVSAARPRRSPLRGKASHAPTLALGLTPGLIER